MRWRAQTWLSSCLCACACAGLLGAPHASAQTRLVLDGSLPNGRTDDLAPPGSGPLYTIDPSLGQARGRNLFHSFELFSIGGFDTVEFVSSDPFDNVITRVTGGAPSSLNGTLRSTVLDDQGGGASFFLLNPHGILFGANSAIDVPGHLFLSTADELRFDDGLALDLRVADAPVLSVAPPSAFGFLGAAPAAEIAFVENGSGGGLTLAMQPGATLAAVGGDVRASGPNGLLSLQTPGGRMGLVAVGEAQASVDVDSLALATLEPERLGHVALEPGASLSGLAPTTPDADQGEVVIRGGRLTIAGADLSFGGNASVAGPGQGPAVDVEVHDAIEIRDGGQLLAISAGSPRGGAARVVGDSLEVSAGAVLTQTTGAGGGGDLAIEVVRLVVEDGGAIGTTVDALGVATGSGGNVRITADDVTLRTGGVLIARTMATGAAGALDVEAARVELDAGQILSRGSTAAPGGALQLVAGELIVANDSLVSAENASGAAGASIRIEASSVEIRNGGRVETSTRAAGAAGDVEIVAGRLTLERSSSTQVAGLVSSTSEAGATGAGGDLRIEVDALTLSGGAQLTTTTRGGAAGAIDIDATGAVVLRGDAGGLTPSGVFSRTLASASGAGGAIEIDARSVAIEDGAELSARSSGPGGAGDVRIQAGESITLSGVGSTGVFGSLVSAQGLVGAGGNVTLSAPDIRVTNGAGVDVTTSDAAPGGRLSITGGTLTIGGRSPDGLRGSTLSAATGGRGDADGIDIVLGGALRLADGASITARSSDSGAAGDVSIQAFRVELDSGARIETRATSTADAGSISIDAPHGLVLRDARITTEALLALGGAIDLRAGTRVSLDRSAVTSSVGQGAGSGGNLRVDAPFVILNEAQAIARAVQGNGGNITITTEALFQSAGSTIDASSAFGLDGEIASTSPAEDLSGQLANLGVRFLDVTQQLRRDCDARTERAGSFLVVPRAGGRRFDADELDLDAPFGAEGSGEVACPTR